MQNLKNNEILNNFIDYRFFITQFYYSYVRQECYIIKNEKTKNILNDLCVDLFGEMLTGIEFSLNNDKRNIFNDVAHFDIWYIADVIILFQFLINNHKRIIYKQTDFNPTITNIFRILNKYFSEFRIIQETKNLMILRKDMELLNDTKNILTELISILKCKIRIKSKTFWQYLTEQDRQEIEKFLNENEIKIAA